MTTLLLLLAITVGPLVVTVGLLGALRRLSALAHDGRPRRRARRGDPLSGLVADLQRLEREHERVRRAGGPDREADLLLRRYDAVLASCCRRAGLAPPRAGSLDPVARLELESALAQRGLTW